MSDIAGEPGEVTGAAPPLQPHAIMQAAEGATAHHDGEGLPEGLREQAPTGLQGEKSPAMQAFEVRMWCGFIFAICAGMLGVGLWLTPNPHGLETHRQLGLPPCGFLLTTGIPCPTCGCTTAVSNFAHGRLLASFLTQPFGFVVGFLAALLVPLSLIGVVSGKWIGPSTFWLSWHWKWWLYGGLGILGSAWVYKIIVYRMMVAAGQA